MVNEEVLVAEPDREEAKVDSLVDWAVRLAEAGLRVEVAEAKEEVAAERDRVWEAGWAVEAGQRASEAMEGVHIAEPASALFLPGSFACTHLGCLEVDLW